MLRKMIHDDGGIRDLLFVDPAYMSTLMDVCKARHNEGMTGARDLPHLAEFPAELVEKYCIVNGISLGEWMANPVHIHRMLQDPDLSRFRIDARNVGRRVE